MQLLPGALTMTDMQKIENYAQCGGAHVITAAEFEIMALPSVNLVRNDVVWIGVTGVGTKGGVAGLTDIYTKEKSGSAILAFIAGADALYSSKYASANGWLGWTFSGMGKVIVTGTYVLGLYGKSAGSDTDVGINAFGCYIWVFRGVGA